MGFDAIAPAYRFFEYAAFRGKLQRHRLRFLAQANTASRALVLGDGDGRFLEQLAAQNPQLTIDAIDASGAMIRLAKKRIHNAHFLQGDARSVEFPARRYDLIATHFFLDCFSAEDLTALATKIARHAAPEARWLVSEFCQPPDGLFRIHAALWLRAMYVFFRLVAGLEASRLPPYRETLQAAGFQLADQHRSTSQLICSELWIYNK